MIFIEVKHICGLHFCTTPNENNSQDSARKHLFLCAPHRKTKRSSVRFSVSLQALCPCTRASRGEDGAVEWGRGGAWGRGECLRVQDKEAVVAELRAAQAEHIHLAINVPSGTKPRKLGEISNFKSWPIFCKLWFMLVSFGPIIFNTKTFLTNYCDSVRKKKLERRKKAQMI